MKSLAQALFTDIDYEVLRSAVGHLSDREVNLIADRFFGKLTIEEMARKHRTTWSELDSMINRILKRLRHLCLEDHRFSRNQRSAIAA